MGEKPISTAVCPKCGRLYHGRPASSREDPSILICPDCGTREALASIGLCEEEQEQIIQTIHTYGQNQY